MRQSHLFGSTRRETPHEEESKNAILLSRGGYVDKTAAGVFSFLPLGLRVLNKVAAIVREEMNRLPYTSEILMPALQPRDIWMETGRWDDPGMKEVMYRVEGAAMGLGATHEENVVDLFRKYFSSYRDLPVAAYQIQTKFRQEARPKSGLMRGREFVMKDLYSFHTSEESLDEYYNLTIEAYRKIYQRIGLQAVLTEASGGVFSKAHSHEFQVINPVGEDLIYLNAAGDYAWNKEICDDETDPKLLEFCGGEVRSAQATEVGNIFKLGTKYSAPMHAEVTSEAGDREVVVMGCYGFGVSRAVGVIAEVYGDVAKGLIAWPAQIAPFRVHLIDLTPDRQGASLYQEFLDAGIEVLYDDRDRSAGEKFADADLVGAPHRIIVSKRSLEAGGVEYRLWPEGESSIVPASRCIELVQ